MGERNISGRRHCEIEMDDQAGRSETTKLEFESVKLWS